MMIEASIPENVLRSMERATESNIDVVRQLSGGWNFGAFEVRIKDSVAVAKVHGGLDLERLHAIRSATEMALSTSGWPTPKWIATAETSSGEVWSIQELIKGASLGQLDAASAEAVITANRLQSGLARRIERADLLFDRSEVARLMMTEDRWGHVARLKKFSTEGNDLIRLLLRPPFEQMESNDLVHGDYNQENILLNNTEVVAFVDTDELSTSPRAFDLVDLFHRSLVDEDDSSGRILLQEEATAQLGEVGFRQCFATTAMGTMSWMIERMPDRVPHRIAVISRWLQENYS